MKKLFIVLIIPFLSFGQDLTYVPDDGFEYWIENNIDGASNGDINDDYVFTDALQNNTNSVVITQTIPIYDLTGIEDFIIRQADGQWANQEYGLTIYDLYVSEIDLSEVDFRYDEPSDNYPDLKIFGNQYLEQIILPKDTMDDLNISDNLVLENLVFQDECVFSELEIFDLPLLCEIIVKGHLDAQNPGFYPPEIHIYGLESLQSVDLSSLTNTPFGTELQFGITAYSWTGFPSLSYINLNNEAPIYNWDLNFGQGLSTSAESFCIQVGDPEFCEGNNDWPQEVSYGSALGNELDINYSSDCNNTVDCETVKIIEPLAINKSLLKKINILGRENTNKGLQLHIYDDGSVEKRYIIE